MMLCAREKAAFGGSLLYVVGVAGGAAGSLSAVETIILPVAATASLIGSLIAVTNEGLRLADCLEQQHPDAAAKLRERFELLGLDIDRLHRRVDQLGGHA